MMETVTVKIKRKQDCIDLPQYWTNGASAMDLQADIKSPVDMYNGDLRIFPTGISVELPAGYEFQVRPRSGLSLRGVTVLNAPGTIDSDYRGEISVVLIQLSKVPVTIFPGDYIAQLVLAKVERCNWEEVSELSESVRGKNGFGSTEKFKAERKVDNV